MIKEVTIDRIYRNYKKKDGSSYRDKNGKGFAVVKITTTDGNSMSYCDFDNETHGWEDGMTVSVNITTKDNFVNFEPAERALENKRPSTPRQQAPASIPVQSQLIPLAELSALKNRVAELEILCENVVGFLKKKFPASGTTGVEVTEEPTFSDGTPVPPLQPVAPTTEKFLSDLAPYNNLGDISKPEDDEELPFL